MALAITHSRANCGIDAPAVTIEVHISNGLPSMSIVGLPETAVKESRDRVRSAILNSGFKFPPRRITVNLAPADLPKKDGGRFDLPIALGILAASEQIPAHKFSNYELAGELALTGQLRPISGAISLALAATNHEHTLIIPSDNANEASLITKAKIYTADHLLEVCSHIMESSPLKQPTMQVSTHSSQDELDMADVYGQHIAKRALEIAAAGNHGVLMVGPPGTGKTMLASRLPSILPPMSDAEALETAAIYSAYSKKFDLTLWRKRPFRTPHHTSSNIALVGGCNPPRPGEVSLAHNGTLFLDELPEFSRHTLEVLREPIEAGKVVISRAAHQSTFPAKFQLIAAMNPCPCGYLGDTRKTCHCTPQQIQHYHAKISGPLLDRIDMTVEVAALHKELWLKQESAESSHKVRKRVTEARERQQQRANKPNAEMLTREVEKHCKLNSNDQQTLAKAMEQMGLSARAYHRILKVARTIADLAQSQRILSGHLMEALSYRRRHNKIH